MKPIYMNAGHRRQHDIDYRGWLIANGRLQPRAEPFKPPAYWTVCKTVPRWLTEMVRRGDA